MVANGLVFEGTSGGTIDAFKKTGGSPVWSASVGTSIAAPDEHNVQILPGNVVAEHQLFVAASDDLVAFAQTASNAPSVTSIGPADGPPAGGTSVTIQGNDFTGATSVRFGSTPASSFDVVSNSEIQVVSPPGAEGAVHVMVSNATGPSIATDSDYFVYAVPTPPSQDSAVTYQGDVVHSGLQLGDSLTVSPTTPLTQKWSKTFGGQVSYPLIADGKVFVTIAGNGSGGTGSQVAALKETTGKVLWGPTTIAGSFDFSAAAYDAGRIYVVDFAGLLSAYDVTTGASDWSTQLPGQYDFTAAPTAYNGSVYVSGAGSGGTVYSINESQVPCSGLTRSRTAMPVRRV